MRIHIWRKISPFWHVITGIIFAVYVASSWVHDVSGFDQRISSNESDINSVKTDIAVIKSRINDIADYIGAPRKNRP